MICPYPSPIVSGMAQKTRGRKLHSSQKGTAYLTRAGSLLVETAQRPGGDKRELVVTLSPKDYRLLEVLHDDVATYIHRLIESHCVGMRKSIKHNNERKRNSASTEDD